MVWLGWTESKGRLARGSINLIEEAIGLLTQEPRLMPHARGAISGSTGRSVSFEWTGASGHIRAWGGGPESRRVTPAWVGVAPAPDALAAAGATDALPVLQIEVADQRGRCVSGLLLVLDGLFDPQDVAWGLRLRYESGLYRPDALPVLASARRPPPQLVMTHSQFTTASCLVFRCDNPQCAGRGQEVMVRTAEMPAVLAAGHGVAYPCPSCPGAWPARWALSFLRRPTPQDHARRWPLVNYPIRPTQGRRIRTPGPMQMVQRSSTGLDLSRWVHPPAPRGVVRFLKSRKSEDLMAAIKEDPARTGSLMAGLMSTENLRSLVHTARSLPPRRRTGGLATALAHGFSPRRATVYQVTHEAAQATHHHYIALDPETFVKKLMYYGALSRKGRFLDVGSGTGEKVFLAFALGAFDRCEGLEFDARTLAVAAFLLQQISTLDPYPIGFMQADALEFDRYGEYDVIYMYRPMHDVSFMNRLFRRVAQQMRAGAIVFDVFTPDCALMKQRDGTFMTTCADPKTGRGQWKVPITLDAFMARMGLNPR